MSNSLRHPSIASRATSALVSDELAIALSKAIAAARHTGAVAIEELALPAMFTRAIADAIDAVEVRGDILRRFLVPGPYDGDDDVPPSSTALSDADTERAITLLYSHTVNCFKGQLAEVLALGPCARLLTQLKQESLVPTDTTLYFGDAIRPCQDGRTAKGADMHLLSGANAAPVLQGVVEVKAFHTSVPRVSRQLQRHITRAMRGLRSQQAGRVPMGVIPNARSMRPIQVTVTLSNWRLPRGYRFVEENGRTFLHADPLPEIPPDTIMLLDENIWHVVLGWSQEALSAEAYGLTSWYMCQLGRDLFAEAGSPWPELSPEEAGANAATQSLYFAIRRSQSRAAEQRAIALYNAHGFGYALGTNYKDRSGRRHMLWVQDLRELLLEGNASREVRIR